MKKGGKLYSRGNVNGAVVDAVVAIVSCCMEVDGAEYDSMSWRDEVRKLPRQDQREQHHQNIRNYSNGKCGKM